MKKEQGSEPLTAEELATVALVSEAGEAVKGPYSLLAGLLSESRDPVEWRLDRKEARRLADAVLILVEATQATVAYAYSLPEESSPQTRERGEEDSSLTPRPPTKKDLSERVGEYWTLERHERDIFGLMVAALPIAQEFASTLGQLLKDTSPELTLSLDRRQAANLHAALYLLVGAATTLAMEVGAYEGRDQTRQ